MNIARINAILVDSLGEVDDNQQPIEGSEVFNFFVIVLALKTAKVHEHAAEMIELLKEWPNESWGQRVLPLGEEINYLTAGGVLDDQRRAFMLFAFGKIEGWWDVMDPHTILGMEYDDPQGLELAGMGMVSIMGYRPKMTV
jgi:hypothetical protein